MKKVAKIKTGPKKEKTPKKESSMSALKVLQKEYNELLKTKKDIDDKIKNYDEIFKLMGSKPKKRAAKNETKTETAEKTGKKRGRKKKEPIIIAEN